MGLLIEHDIASKLPAIVIKELANMEAHLQDFFVEEFKHKKKSIGWAYFRMTIFGLFTPYSYIGKWGKQIAYWICGILIPVPLAVMSGNLNSLIIFQIPISLWNIYLLFTIPNLVRKKNKDIAIKIIRDMKVMG